MMIAAIGIVAVAASAGVAVKRIYSNHKANVPNVVKGQKFDEKRKLVETLKTPTNFTVGNGLPITLFERMDTAWPESSAHHGEYGMIVDINGVEELYKKGWEVRTVTSEAFKACTEVTKDCQIMAFLGYYSKGKSFLAANVAKAANEELDAQLAGLKIQASGDFSIKTGDSVTTKGLSGFFTRDGSKLFLDSAGRNAPAERTATEDAATTEKAINALRSKERLLDDILIDISNVLVYVVDEVLNEDQRTILHIIQQHRESKKRTSQDQQVKDQSLCIVHNFKRKKPSDPDSQAHINEQLEKSFSAVKQAIEPRQKESYGENIQYWKSEFPDSKTRIGINVYHFVLYDHCTHEGLQYNNCVFKFLAQFRSDRGIFQVGAPSPIQKICKSVSKFIPFYVRETIGVDEAVDAIHTDIQMSETGVMVIKAFPREPNAHLELLEWNLRDSPRSRHDGEYQPNFNYYEDLEKKRFFIRVDLPGFSTEHKKKPGEEPAEGTTFFDYALKEELYDYDTYDISGYRYDENKETAPKGSFGKFHIEIPVRHYFKGSREIVKFENSVLTIILQK
jgi:HSP20 family molecular chaperone IbpA